MATGGSHSGCTSSFSLAAGRSYLIEGRAVKHDYQIGEEIGEGGFSQVRRVYRHDTGEAHACKSIAKTKAEPGAEDPAWLEVAVMAHLTSPSNQRTVNLKAVYERPTRIDIVMDYCAGGDLMDVIVRRGRSFSEADAARLFRQMAEAVAYCHARGIMHRDIKLENFMLADRSMCADLKLGDFGFAVPFKHGQTFTMTMGTPQYVAPEVLRGSYSPAADMWSLGASLYIMLSGAYPFDGASRAAIERAVQRSKVVVTGARWKNISEEAKDLICGLLCPNPVARLTPGATLAHPWLRREQSARPLGASLAVGMEGMLRLSRMQSTAVRATVRSLTLEEMETLWDELEAADTDGDGLVTLAQLRGALDRAAGGQLNDPELLSAFARAGRGALRTTPISYADFLGAALDRATATQGDVDNDNAGGSSATPAASAPGSAAGRLRAHVRACGQEKRNSAQWYPEAASKGAGGAKAAETGSCCGNCCTQ